MLTESQIDMFSSRAQIAHTNRSFDVVGGKTLYQLASNHQIIDKKLFRISVLIVHKQRIFNHFQSSKVLCYYRLLVSPN